MSSDTYYNEIISINNAAYNDAHMYELGIQSSFWSILFKSGTSPIYYSFNGTDDHGVVSDLAGFLQYQTLEPWVTRQFWLRGGTGDEIVEVTARGQ